MHVSTAHVLQQSNESAIPAEVLDRTTAYKTGVNLFPKMLREKVATLHLPVLGSVLFAHTQELVLPPEFYGQFCIILHASRFQILCQSDSTHFAVSTSHILRGVVRTGNKNAAWYVACGTPFLRQAESCYQTLGSVIRMSSCSSGETLANARASALGKGRYDYLTRYASGH